MNKDKKASTLLAIILLVIILAITTFTNFRDQVDSET